MASTLTGRVIAEKYKIGEQLGSGGMGDVYRARHLTLEKDVALKVIRPETTKDPTVMKRFVREARATSRLQHQNIIQVLDFGTTDDNVAYMVMEYVDGIELSHFIKPLTLESTHLIHICMQICDALDEAHTMGIIHRDLKPENVIITQRRTDPLCVKVLDFGIAKIFDPETGVAWGTRVTRDGIVCGTPEYMSPEQAQGKKVDGRSDLYALGIMMYELLCGDIPFKAESPVELLTQHILNQPQHIRERVTHINDDLANIVMDLIKKHPDQRPNNAREVKNRLESIHAELNKKTPMLSTPTNTAIVTHEIHRDESEAIPIAPIVYHAFNKHRLTVATGDIEQETKQHTQKTTSPKKPHEKRKKTIHAWLAAGCTVSIASIAWILMMPEQKMNHDQIETPSDASDTQTDSRKPIKTREIELKHTPSVQAKPAQTLKTNSALIVRPYEEEQRRSQNELTQLHAVQHSSPPQPNIAELMKQARHAKANEQWEKVVTIYKHALQVKRSPDMYKEIARAYLKLQDRAHACEYFKRFINAHTPDKREDATHRIAPYLKQCN